MEPVHPQGSMSDGKGRLLGHGVLVQQHFESPRRPWDVRGILHTRCVTGGHTMAQRSSVTPIGHTLGQSLPLSLGLPLRFLPLTSFCSTARFLCSSPGQPGLKLASGALCPNTARGQQYSGTSWASGQWDRSVETSLPMGTEGTLVMC